MSIQNLLIPNQYNIYCNNILSNNAPSVVINDPNTAINLTFYFCKLDANAKTLTKQSTTVDVQEISVTVPYSYTLLKPGKGHGLVNLSIPDFTYTKPAGATMLFGHENTDSYCWAALINNTNINPYTTDVPGQPYFRSGVSVNVSSLYGAGSNVMYSGNATFVPNLSLNGDPAATYLLISAPASFGFNTASNLYFSQVNYNAVNNTINIGSNDLIVNGFTMTYQQADI